jgi:type I restriction enzyme, S subunit
VKYQDWQHMNKNKLIPELRFPDFVKDGEWMEQELIDLVDKKVRWSFTGGPFGSNLKASDYTSKGIRIIQLQNIGDGEFNDEYKIYTTEEKADELLSCNIYSGEIILSKMGDPVGRACIIPDNLIRCVMASDGIRLVVDEKKYSKYFIYSLINSKQIREAIEKKATGSTRKRIGLDELREIKLIIPKELEEQQKIASCLSSLDEVIAAHSQKFELLKDHKKGLMQNLFPQEGEKVPKYRFKEFEKDGEWVEKELGAIAEFVSKKTSLENLSVNTYISTENLLADYAGVVSASKLPAIGNFTKYKEEDILISNIRPYLKKVWFADKQGGCSNDVFVVRSKSEINKLFLSFWLKNDDFINYVMVGAKGVKMPRGDKDLISKYTISFPQNKQEQQKISSCLSSLDALIAAQAEKIEQLKLHKKGLMQGLFPIINE